MADAFANHMPGLDAPATRHARITPSATALDPKPRALRCNSAGTVTIVDDAGVSETYDVTAGEVLPFRGTKITAATATVTAWW